MREVAEQTVRVFPRSMSDLEPGASITESKGISTLLHSAGRTNVHLNLPKDLSGGTVEYGSPAFIVPNFETPGAVFSNPSVRLGTKII